MSEIIIKSSKEIEIMRLAGQKLARIRKTLLKRVAVGVTGLEIEALAQELIKKEGVKPSFSRVPNYHWATCVNVNHGVVHGVPNDYRFKKGDLVSVDVGLYYQGFHSDCSATVIAGYSKIEDCPNSDKTRFLKVGKETLKKAIAQAKAGHRVGHISRVIEQGLVLAGYAPILTLTGHGIGRQLHEAPKIPGFLNRSLKDTPLLKVGMTLAIEVIYTAGQPETKVSPRDHWTVEVKDGKITAIFEETIAIKNDGPFILTQN